MIEWENLRPRKSLKVFDLVEEAGFDVEDWIASSNDKRGYKAIALMVLYSIG